MKPKEKHPDTVTDECEFCDGTGEVQESCCGNRLNDMGICTGCGEHTYVSGDACEECNGTGKIEKEEKYMCSNCKQVEVDKPHHACETCCVRGTNGYNFKLD